MMNRPEQGLGGTMLEDGPTPQHDQHDC